MKISRQTEATATRPTLDDIRTERAQIAQQIRELKERANVESFSASRETFAEVARLETVSAFLANNYEVICFEILAESVARIFKKYDGKPYGTKTAQKIREEVLADCGFSIYIDSNRFTLHAKELRLKNVYTYVGESLDVTTKAPNTYFLTADNKICAQPVENLHAYGLRDFCDDIPGAVAKLDELKKQATELREKYNDIADKFNKIAPLTVEHLPRYYR